MAGKKAISRPGAERYILAVCLNYHDAILDLATKLTTSDFYEEYNASIYEACLRAVENERNPEPGLIYEYFERTDRLYLLEELQGMKYLKAIKNTPCDVHNVQEYVDQVKQASARRILLERLDKASKKITDEENKTPGELIALAEEEIIEADEQISHTTSIVHHMGDNLDIIWENVAQDPGKLPGLPTGYPRLDMALQGLQQGRTYIVTAPKKEGKSALLMNVANNLAILPEEDKQYPVLFVATEMQTDQDQFRLWSMVSGVEEQKLKNGLFLKNEEETAAAKRAVDKIKNGQLYHAYLPYVTFESLYSVVRKYVKTKGIQLLIFDYIKLTDDGDANNGWAWIGKFTSNLVNKISGDMNLAVLSAAQINREGQKIRSSSSLYIGGSEQIAQYASGAILPFYEKPKDGSKGGYGPEQGTHTLEIADSRYTQSDMSFHFYYNKPILKMKEVKEERL